MKKITNGALYKMCSLCIALGWIIHYNGPSLLFFGEPDFPSDEQ